MAHDCPDPDILVRLGRNLKAARLGAGLTQGELAGRAGLAPAFVAELEGGALDPDLRALGALADALGCPAFELVGEGLVASSS